MKKITALVLFFVLAFCFTACSKENENFTTELSKNGVEEFLELLGKHPNYREYIEEYLSEECYNITPEEVLEETDFTVFKFASSCETFALADGNIYSLCNSFGGYGAVNMLPCDFDMDGNKDLLVASSWGSGVHQGEISVFRKGNISPTVIYSTINGDTLHMDLALTKSPLSIFTGDENDTKLVYAVWGAYVKANDGNFADLTYELEEPIGWVESQNGKAVFVPYEAK